MARFEIIDDEPRGRFEIIDAPVAKKKVVGGGDRLQAGVAALNKGFFSDLLGMPVDAAANAIDLGKAAIGYGTSKVTGKAPPQWTEPFDRTQVPLSGEWLAKQINKGSGALGMGSPIDNPNPQDQLSRLIYSGGRVAGSSIVPNANAPISGLKQLANLGMGAVSGVTGGAVGEVSPEYAGVAGMLPQLSTAMAVSGIKRGIRGNEAGRKNMDQRLQDFKNAGVDEPSVGLTSGNKLIQGIENILSLTPGSVGVFEKSKQKMLSGMQNKANNLRDSISTEYGPIEAGAALQADLKGLFKERIGNTYGTLNDKVEQAVGPNMPVPVAESIFKSGQLTTPIPGAEATSSNFINSRIAKINKDLSVDAGGKPEKVVNGLIVLPNGLPATQTVIPATPPQGVPFSALKDLRTKIGKEAASNAIMGTPEQGEFKQLYGAMSQDMKNGVSLADLKNGIDPASPGSATTALNRANTFYSRAMNRVDQVNPLANRSTPEGAYKSLANSLNAGPTVYSRLRGLISPESRQKIVATVIDDLGKANPGQQNEQGDVWSPRSFLTGYNKLLDAKSKKALFTRLPGGEKMSDQLTDIAKAADMVNESSKVWANPSGTAPALAARGTLGAVTFGWFFFPMEASIATGGILAANQVSKRLLLNPKFVNWLAKTPEIRPQDAQSYAQRLIATANLTNNAQFKSDVSDYLSEVNNQLSDAPIN
tara:strand:+ start:9295 stop:11409 length:2115 start_codon:yes stop_codon:yes gene_type:complete